MFLTTPQLEQFRSQGWLCVERFWSAAEVAAMRDELTRLEHRGKLRNVATAGDGKTPDSGVANLQLCPLAPHSELFTVMSHAPQAVEAVTQLIGAPNVLHLDQVFLKPARHGAGTNWHQDDAYFRISDPFRGTALWTAVHDATIENGTLRVIPAAFESCLPHDRDPMSNHHIRCWPDESRALPIEVEAGGVIFFCYRTPHSTGGNQTDRDRAGVALHYLHGEERGTAAGGYPVEERRLVADADGQPADAVAAHRWAELVASR